MNIMPVNVKIFLLALLLIGAGTQLAAQAPTPFHENPSHANAARQCLKCHGGHKTPGINSLKAHVADFVCGSCHSPVNLAKWKVKAQYNGTFIPNSGASSTIIPPNSVQGSPFPPPPFQGKIGN